MLHSWTSFVTVSAMLVYAWNFAMAGKMRGKHKIMAPAVTGHPEFESALRVQQNMVEQLVLFLPVLWIFATTVSERWAGIIGIFFVIGRVVYSRAYYNTPESRGTGFMIAGIATLLLLLGSLLGVLRLVFFGVP